MSKYCVKCGAGLRDTEVFCPKCGTVQNGQVINTGLNVNAPQMANNYQSTGTRSNNRKYALIGALVVFVMLVGGFLISLFNHDDKKADQTRVTQEATTTSSVNADNGQMQAAVPANSPIAKAEHELWQKGVQGTVLASSIGHSGSGYLSVIKTNNNQYQIVTYDTKNDRVGITQYDRKILYFTNKKPQGNGKESVIFNITILNDSADRDSSSGAWESGYNHNLPVYADYKFDGAGNLIPGMLTTGAGAKPSHYQAYFNEQRNVDTINLFLTEMMALQKNIADNKVVLP